jgi:hypothetical protein
MRARHSLSHISAARFFHALILFVLTKLPFTFCKACAHALADMVRMLALKCQNISQEGLNALVECCPALKHWPLDQ